MCKHCIYVKSSLIKLKENNANLNTSVLTTSPVLVRVQSENRTPLNDKRIWD